MEIEWSEEALADMAALDKTIAHRVKQAVEEGIHPPEFRLRVGDWRVRFRQDAATIRVLRVRNRREAYR